MPRISILPETLINKIAAGEVIERPASIVRELIDNSIDAGASQIHIEVVHGGKKLIKVSDNGSGMERDDALLCFERHATSKILTEEDLFSINTLGFRGEALAAIASVSKVILTTSSINVKVGTKIEIGANRKKEVSDAPYLEGTAIEVRDIFYNTPARRKFLKSTSTELSHIIDIVTQKAFAYPEISFSLLSNNSEVLSAPVSAGIRERFIQLYGGEFVSEFINVRNEGSGIEIYGFTSKTDFIKTRRSHQFIFINKRPVKNPTISHAIYSAYGSLIPKDGHPAYFIFLCIDPKKVDVNVHPAKREVRFEAPDEIHRQVEEAIYEALYSKRREKIEYLSPLNYKSGLSENLIVRESEAGMLTGSQTDFFSAGITHTAFAYFHLRDAFIATVTENGLLIIDQHAAHERILYEKFLKKTLIETETLLLPIRVELPAKEYDIIIRNKGLMNDIGFEISEFGGKNLIVRTMPKEFQKAVLKVLLLDIATCILEEDTSGITSDLEKKNLLQNIAARLACHKSVRGREPLNNEEIARMMSDLNKTDVPDTCPHGRPTKVLLSIDDLRRMFKRK